MPKMKTNRSAAKRFTLTGSGKLKRRKSNKRHILFDKAPKRKRHLRKGTLVSKADGQRVLRMLGLR